ncbi:SDR family oxidoreductase [Psychroflexus planctonicus]|uniref:Short-chain dehydrogenase/reductase n=1 Tax=Psychroflexus planctonicus TaxID=1526575 RepID=A0ABQ1SGM4_9FLAO|nr:SDR family oxidoreductase [Psychroflexus planctonicus]GGE32789.1 short-chain dehydrogenase/reductase [Psychroflexus planctonicus]
MPKVILITGASSGIGIVTAEFLTENNFKVYGTSRNPSKDSLNGVHFVQLDLNDSNSIEKAVDKIITNEGKIDVLINNAGVGITGPIEETPIKAARAHFQTNFFGVMELTQRVLPLMRNQNEGQIINVTSIAGYMGLPFRGYYSASKSALITLTEALRLELKNTNIKVSCLAPGDFATNIASGRFTVEANPKSNYFKAYSASLKLMNAHVDEAENPIEVAQTIFRIIQKEKPKAHYKVGSPLQKFSVFLKGILPDKVFENMLAKHYKL